MRQKPAGRHERFSSPNVVGLLRGSDPQLSNEYVVFSAHLDHIGSKDSGEGDTIYNGFVDNAVGVAIMLESARALAKLTVAPRRSIVFIAVTGEEFGLLGSDYFVNNPTVPNSSIVTNVNIDMPQLLFPMNTITTYGAERSSLEGPTAAEVALEGFEARPDPYDDESEISRSDQYSFLLQGIPFIWLAERARLPDPNIEGMVVFTAFLEEHYHQLSDDLSQPIDWDTARRFARASARIMRRIAMDDDAPVWKEGDFIGEKFGEKLSKEKDNGSANVFTLVEKPSGIKEAERLGQWFPASDFEALGIYLPPGQPIEIVVKNFEGNTQPKLLVGIYSRYLAEDVPTVHDLVAGQNSITDKDGGLLYLKYVTEDVATGEVEVTIKGGEPTPVYKLGETSHEDWLHMLSSMSYEDVLFVSNRTMVVVSKKTALNFKDLSQDEMLMTLDRISDIEDYISGIDGSSDLHKPNVHKLLITETADTDYFLAAEEHRVFVVPDACNKFMDPNAAATEAWGVWHEMGHMRQTVNWDWDEVDEVTVNIYSLAAKRGLKSNKIWLEGNEVWDMLDDYFNVPLEDRNYNSSKMLKGKGRLAMFQQLWLAYGDEFYIKVHRLTREEKAETPKTEYKMAYFMLVSSKVSGYNLKEFFTQWGFKLPQEYFDALDDLSLPKPAIDLLALRE